MNKKQDTQLTPKLLQYAAIECDSLESESVSYFLIYESMEEVIKAHGDGVAIFEATFKLLGNYKKETKIVKYKSKKS